MKKQRKVSDMEQKTCSFLYAPDVAGTFFNWEDRYSVFRWKKNIYRKSRSENWDWKGGSSIALRAITDGFVAYIDFSFRNMYKQEDLEQSLLPSSKWAVLFLVFNFGKHLCTYLYIVMFWASYLTRLLRWRIWPHFISSEKFGKAVFRTGLLK